jgi:hypothetical protein
MRISTVYSNYRRKVLEATVFVTYQNVSTAHRNASCISFDSW